jgi:hypothetical protein
MAKRQKERQHNGQKTEGKTTQWPKDRRKDNTMAKSKMTNNDLKTSVGVGEGPSFHIYVIYSLT